MINPVILQIAVPVPFRKLFDYLPASLAQQPILKPGMRVKIPFGKTEKVGVLINVTNSSEHDPTKLKAVTAYLDEEPIFDKPLLKWLIWVSQYYHHPMGETLFTALPTVLRQAKTATLPRNQHWQRTALSQTTELKQLLARAPQQLRILEFFEQNTAALNAAQLNEKFKHWRQPLKQLIAKNLVEEIETPFLTTSAEPSPLNAHSLNQEQRDAVEKICSKHNTFNVSLVDGITGSGKTEVYINAVARVLEQNRQALILIPEIGLTTQLLERFARQFRKIAVIHSNLNDTERYAVWRTAREGQISVLIGTRSAIFTPFKNLGIIVIDEEHDLSFKQQDGLRYSARDIAITRAKGLNIPVVLGSATPSLESLANVEKKLYQHITLRSRAGVAELPQIKTINLKHQTLKESFHAELLHAIKQTLEKKQQVLVFLNRRGYAPTMICHECSWVAKCQRCDHPMTIHLKRQRIICHHCGAEKRIVSQCPDCGCIDLRPIGFGTERIETFLKEEFPATEIIRIDRDTTARKHAMENLLQRIDDNKPQILLGTQMLAKGHDFPNVTLVGLLNADQGLFGIDMRATERMAQLILQVAGRAGRGTQKGLVLIQTFHPEHPLFNTISAHNYQAFANETLEQRKCARLPPFSHAALLRSESASVTNNFQFLQQTRQLSLELRASNLEILGPVSSPLERKAGRYRHQLLFMSESRKSLHQLLERLLPKLEIANSAKKVRWSIDVDPMEMC